jgi:glycosyltransferase XagB
VGVLYVSSQGLVMGVTGAAVDRMQARESLDAGFAQDHRKFDVENLPEEWAFSAVQRLTQTERDLLLRHKVLAYSWMPGETLHAVVHDGALRDCSRLGLAAFGRLSPETYRKLVRRVLSPLLLQNAVHGLSLRQPGASARQRLSGPQKLCFSLIAISLGLLAGFTSLNYMLGVTQIIAGLFFLMVVVLRCLYLLPLPQGPDIVAPIAADDELPIYTLLVPLFREIEVLEQLIHALCMLDYPPQKLDIKIILEENDRPMHEAIHALDLPWNFDVIIVPSGRPQTKPRALNYALQFARGSLVTIYDGEDIPQPNQLKLAAAQFAVAGDDLGCLQAALTFYNPAENWLTRQFTAEYAALFHVILPTLAAYGLPLPLGGTSNHFRASALAAVGAWDAFNVTEDADLGIRLARHGFKTGVLNSTTFEEANPALGNWMRQRRRWLKGFLQTWLVHNRNPLLLLRETGLAGACTVHVITLGVFASALLHPILLATAIWNFLPAQILRQADSPVAPILAGFSLAILLAGYVSAIGASEKGLRRIGSVQWTGVLLTIPFYWMLISAAAWMALWDFIVAPFHWHKTRHGLSRMLRPTNRF